jgi:tetratricopeptide (TPR) repeat protein
MMKKYFFVLFSLSICVSAISQSGKKKPEQKNTAPSQAEINKMMQEALQNLPPEQRAMAEQMMKQQQQKMSGNTGNNAIPVKKNDLLKLIPKFSTSDQYNSFLEKMKQQAIAKINAETKRNIDQLVEKYKQNKTGLNNIPITLFMQGQTEAAIYSAIICAQLNYNIQLSQNNLAFILHQTGYPQYALPLLEYYLAKTPDAVMYNNAGQCYFTLGDTAKAMRFFAAALRLDDYIAEAHCGTALLLIGQKKTAEATPHIEKALRDGYSTLLEDAVNDHNIKLNSDKMRKTADEYFKPVDYAPLPPVRTMEELKLKYEKTERLQAILNRWQVQRDATANSFKSGNSTWEMNKVEGTFSRPFRRKAWFMSRLLTIDLGRHIQNNTATLQQYSKKMEQEYGKMEKGIDTEYKTGSFNSSYEECKMKEKYLDSYLQFTFVSAKEAENILYLKIMNNVNQQLHWMNFLLESNEFKHQYFNLGTYVLSTQLSLSNVQKMYPLPINIANNCNEVLKNPPEADEVEGVSGKCAYSLKIPAVIGSIKFTCDGWEIEGGELFVLNVIRKYNRKNDFTIAFGLGGGLDLGTQAAGIKGQFYIVVMMMALLIWVLGAK